MKPSDNEIEMLAAGFAIQHKNGLIRFAHALLEKYASARAIALDASTVAGEATYYAVMHGNALYGIFGTEAAAEACKAQGHPDAPFSVKPLYAAPQASDTVGLLRKAAEALAGYRREMSLLRAEDTQPCDAERAIIAALKTQADKDGGQQRAGDGKTREAVDYPRGGALNFDDPALAGAEGIRSQFNACMHRNECRAMLDRQQRAGDAALARLAEPHTGMRVDYQGLLRQAREGLHDSPGLAEMLRQLQGHLRELGQRWYAGDTAVVDELLQLYCVESNARAALSAPQAEQGERDAKD